MKKKSVKNIEVLNAVSDNKIVTTEEESFSPEDLLPIVADEHNHDLTVIPEITKDLVPVRSEQDKLLQLYIKEISRYKVLGPDEEKELIEKLEATGDVDVAKKLVVHNLKLVVKIAMEYKRAWQNMMDLIQEGNIGLMKAVSKYDSSKGAKLSYYASWWIRSYILKFILDNFRMVKVGTTNEQKKLFFNLIKEKERLESQGIMADTKAISASLGVSEKSVVTMNERLGLGSGDVALDTPMDRNSSNSGTVGDTLPDDINLEETFSNLHDLEILKENLDSFLKTLKDRDREVFERRLMLEVPDSLQDIANEFGVSRERVRQIEARILENLKVYMSKYMR